MAMIEESVAEGLEMYAQTTPRPLGTLFGIDMERNPFCYHPSYKAIAHEKLEKKLATMCDPTFRAKLLAEQPEQDDAMLARRICQFDFMFPFGDPPDYAPPREQCITAIAEREGRSPYEVVYDYMLEDDGRAMLFAPDNNYLDYSNDACRELIEHPQGIVAVGDGGAHAAHVSDISFPTYVMSYWGRDRPEGALDLGFLVRQITSETAYVVGLSDRGIIASGYKGDLNVIDMERLSIARPYMAHDLPLGVKRLLQRADGYLATIVSGVPIYRDGEPTGALPGRLVRGPQPAP
jgi:N-acyl-D-aspartate/D-glutamate deacylase